MSIPERRAMVERPSENLSVRRQGALLNLARSGVYRPIPATCADDLAMMRRIDELHLNWPFYGSRRMAFELNQAGPNRKRVQRLMRVMGIEALVRRPGTSKAALGHKIYPYLLRVSITEPNHVWASDITYIPMALGFLYLVGDHRLGHPGAWVAAVKHDGYGLLHHRARRALSRHGTPKIFNTDQGAQFTSVAFTGRLEAAGIAISMDGRGRFMDHRMLLALDQTNGGTSFPLRHGEPAPTGSRRRWICRFAWTTQTRCPHTHSRRTLDSNDKGSHTLTSALGPRYGGLSCIA